jgi:hypothetical protein
LRDNFPEDISMANAKSAPVKGGMKDQTSGNIARDGAAKRPQTKFAVKAGMKNSQAYSADKGIGGSGPDASSPNPLAKEAISKGFKDAPAAWGMKDSNDRGVDHDQGRAVLSEAALGC